MFASLIITYSVAVGIIMCTQFIAYSTYASGTRKFRSAGFETAAESQHA